MENWTPAVVVKDSSGAAMAKTATDSKTTVPTKEGRGQK